jgi:hypothetical protein
MWVKDEAANCIRRLRRLRRFCEHWSRQLLLDLFDFRIGVICVICGQVRFHLHAKVDLQPEFHLFQVLPPDPPLS